MRKPISYIDTFLTVEKYQAWLNQGLSESDMLEEMGYSRKSNNVMAKWKKKNGLASESRWGTAKRIPEDFTPADFLALKQQGKTTEEIRLMHGVTQTILYKWINKYKTMGKLPSGNISFDPYARLSRRDAQEKLKDLLYEQMSISTDTVLKLLQIIGISLEEEEETVKILKTRHDTPTKIAYGGQDYALIHKDYINGNKNKVKSK